MAGIIGELVAYLWLLVDVFKRGLRGSPAYYLFLGGLGVIAGYGIYVWVAIQHAPVFLGADYGGLVLTGANESVPWGIYIAFFIFWIGVAASAVILSFAAYVYGLKEFKKVVVIAEAQAVVSLIIAVLGIVAMLGRPVRAMFLMPQFANLRSMLDWDFIVIFTYMGLNAVAYLYTLRKYSMGEELSRKFLVAYLVVSTPFAIGIHTVTAMIFQALTARPILNTPLLPARFLATAFASGPAILLLVVAIAEKYAGFRVEFDLYKRTLQVMILSLATGLFFTLVEAHEVFWYTTEELKKLQAETLFFGKFYPPVGVLFWLWIALGVAAVLLPLLSRDVRETKRGVLYVSVLIIIAVVMEKSVVTLYPAFIPDTLGRVHPYYPTPTEYVVLAGYHAALFILYAILAKTGFEIVSKKYGIAGTA